MLGPAFRAGVADRIQDIANGSDRLLLRDAGRRILPSDEKGALAGMGIAAVPHPAMLLAFADGASSRINRAHPSIVRNAGRRSFIINTAVTPHRTSHESFGPARRSGC